MKDNPYSKWVEIIKKEGASYSPPSIMLGDVISSNPLTIKIGDLQIGKGDIFISDFLLSEYKRIIKLPQVPATGKTEENSGHTHNVDEIGIDEVKITFLDGLNKGDKLAIMPTVNRQKYIILARVVSL